MLFSERNLQWTNSLTPSNEHDFLTIEWLRSSVAEVGDASLQSYFAITPDGATPSLCAPAQSYDALIESVIAVTERANVELGYMSNRKRVVLSDRAQLSQELASKPNVQIRLFSGQKRLAFFIEKWTTEGSALVAPRPNLVTKTIQLGNASADAFFDTPGKNLNELYPTPLMEECVFPIDAVYTWVNSADAEWQKMFAEHGGEPDADRFSSRDELRYSLRSLFQFAPWVHRVFVVSNCPPPDWFDKSNQRVVWVPHEDIIDPALLPTFNSHAIEASLHRIPDLSEHFLYFNDDMFLMRPVSKTDFFQSNGIAKIRPEPYGSVHGDVDARDPDYINAARNGQALLQAEFVKTPTRPFAHSPHSMQRSVAQACEDGFAEPFQATRASKFRSITDISPTSFLYPNFAFLTGNAVMDYTKTAMVNSNHSFRERLESYSELLNAAKFAELPISLCINDGGGSTTNDEWERSIVEFMSSAFPIASEAEKSI